MNQNEQNELAIKKETPKAREIRRRKEIFLEVLRTNGGSVSDAFEKSGLKRTAAYTHYRNDPQFAEDWRDALESGLDALYEEARRRAVDGIEEPVCNGGRVVSTAKRYSDTLLIFLLKQGEYQRRWKYRLMQAGELAIQSVNLAAADANLTEQQIAIIHDKMLQQFENVKM